MRAGIARKTLAAAVMAVMAAGSVSAAEDCTPEVQQALDKQRESYIAAYSDLASQNFSRRPGTFASMTCLDNLMQGGGVDIFFKPPSLDNILNMVKNLACEQASQIFDQLVGGSGLNGGGMLNPGEILPGVNLGGNLVQLNTGGSNFSVNHNTIKDLFR